MGHYLHPGDDPTKITVEMKRAGKKEIINLLVDMFVLPQSCLDDWIGVAIDCWDPLHLDNQLEWCQVYDQAHWTMMILMRVWW